MVNRNKFSIAGRRNTVIKALGWILSLSLLTPYAMAQEFELYVVDIGLNRQAPWQVLKYDENGQNPEVFINTELNRPQDIVFLEEKGTAIVSNLLGGNITRYDAETGEYIDDFATGIGQPTRMKIGPDGLLYVLQWAGNGKVWRYDLDGNFVDEFTSVGVSQSIGMDWDSEGNLYVASFNGPNVRKFNSNGLDQGLFISSDLVGPTNIWFEENGDLVALDWSARNAKRWDANGVYLGIIITGLIEPEGVDFLDNGDFLIGTGGGSAAVEQYTEAGVFVKEFVSSSLGQLAKPNAVIIRRINNFNINAGLNDAWVNVNAPFQGLFVTVFPAFKLVFVAWFTFDSGIPPADPAAVFGANDQRWVTGIGSFSGNRAELKMELTSGGIFNGSDPLAGQDTGYGTMTLVFLSCALGTVSYDFPSASLVGEFQINRVLPDNEALCTELEAEE